LGEDGKATGVPAIKIPVAEVLVIGTARAVHSASDGFWMGSVQAVVVAKTEGLVVVVVLGWTLKLNAAWA
jgi:hypothetical protein